MEGEQDHTAHTMRSKDLTINGLRQRLYTWGSPKRPKLFLLHGWLDTGAGFQFLAEYLQDRFHCIAPDMRGYGKSGHTKNPLGYFFHEYVADAHALFAKFSPKEPVRLLGHSLGGIVASVYAGSFPARVNQLINVEGYLIPDRPPEIGPSRVRDWIEGVGKKRFRSFPTLKAFAERLRQSNPHLTEARALFLSKYLAKRSARGFTMAADPKHKLMEPYWVPLVAHYAYWSQIQARCLLVSAEKTEMAARFGPGDFWAGVREREAHFPPGTKTIKIPDCGHMVQHHRPEAMAEAVLQFLK